MGMSKNVVIMGPPGSGKGTQAAVLSRRTGLVKISTGDILRSAVEEGTDLGRRAQAYMDRGELVPDSLMLELVRGELADRGARDGWILDGFPRTIPQAEGLEGVLEELGQRIDMVLLIRVSPEEILRRISARVEMRGGVEVRRSDDDEQTVRKRLAVYEKETAPVVDFYRRRTRVKEIDGEAGIDSVTKSIFHALDEHDHS
jgi:adenylate kinase